MATSSLSIYRDLHALGNVHKGCLIFLRFLEIPTYLCPIHYVLSIYVLCLIFLDIPTYPNIGHPL
jgi:hypothetical protein